MRALLAAAAERRDIVVGRVARVVHVDLKSVIRSFGTTCSNAATHTRRVNDDGDHDDDGDGDVDSDTHNPGTENGPGWRVVVVLLAAQCAPNVRCAEDIKMCV